MYNSIKYIALALLLNNNFDVRTFRFCHDELIVVIDVIT